MKLGLLLGAGACWYVALASWISGYPPEVAIVRGVTGWAAIALVGYAAELVVVTTPAPRGAQRHPLLATPAAGDEPEADDDDEVLVA